MELLAEIAFLIYLTDLEGLAFLKVTGGLVCCVDEELFSLFFCRLDLLVKLLGLFEGGKVEADAEGWVDGGVFAASEGLAEVAVFYFGDIFLCSLDVVGVEINVFVVIHSDEVEGFLRLATEQASILLPSHHLGQYLKVLLFRMI